MKTDDLIAIDTPPHLEGSMAIRSSLFMGNLQHR
jgi:hypothetical protein